MSSTFEQQALNYWQTKENYFKRQAVNTTDAQTALTYLKSASEARRMQNYYIDHPSNPN